MRRQHLISIAFGLSVASAILLPAHAQAPPPAGPAASEGQQRQAIDEEIDKSIAAAAAAATRGDTELISQAILKLPKGFQYVPAEPGARLMRAMGNRTGSDFVGLVLPDPLDRSDWFFTLKFTKSGYVKDDDAKDWKADELLQSLKDGTDSGNEDRVARGFPPIEVAGWVEPPKYDAVSHRLVWAALVRRKAGATDGSVNYNTYALGREGYFELNMVGSPAVITAEKGRALELLGSLDYVAGKRYEDFNPSTDRVAEYGLAALIAGVAAKKLGLLAVFGVMLLKFWKLLAIGFFGAAWALGKMFGRKQA